MLDDAIIYLVPKNLISPPDWWHKYLIYAHKSYGMWFDRKGEPLDRYCFDIAAIEYLK
jgi:hypothetical protein